MRREFLSVVLCVCMMMTMAPFAWAAEQPTAITADTTTLSDGTSYILNGDVTLSQGALTIPENTTVSINLNNHKLTNKDGNHTIVNNGALTITGRGTVDNVSNGTAALYNNAGATATLNGGTYTRSKEAGKSADNSGGNSYYTLKNFGTMTINSGVTVNQGADGNGKYSSLVANGWQNGSTAGNSSKEPAVTSSGAQMTINGGTFSGGLNTIKNDDYGTITINGGTFQNYAQACFLNWNKATVNGGNFNGAASAQAAILNGYGNDTMDTGTLSITGGIFSGAVGVKAMTTNTTADLKNVAVSGGVFSSLESSLVATGYTSANIGGKTVVVTNGATAVAKIGDNGFASAQNAFDAVQDGETITLLADCSAGTYNEAYIPADKSVTLDLNGKTLTIGADCGIELQGKLTVTGNGNITCANTPIRVNGSSAELIVNDGTIESTGDYGIYAMDGGSVIVNGGTISSKDAALSGNNTTGTMNFTVNGGTLTAAQGPAIYMPGQVALNISGGTLNGGVSLRMGQVNISGGTINAITKNIDSPSQYYNYSGNAWLPDALYVFGGTYPNGDETHGNSLNLNITGGTFNCTNGQGSAVAIYDLGKVKQDATIKISGTAKLATNASSRSAYQVLSLEDIGVTSSTGGYGVNSGKVTSSITGGLFSTTINNTYCATGLTAISNTDEATKADYPYTVGTIKAEGDNQVKETTTTGNTIASVSDTITDKTGATSVGQSVKPENVITDTTPITETDKNQALTALVNDGKVTLTDGKIPEGTTVTVVKKTYLDVTVTTYDTTAKKISMEITPKYDLIAVATTGTGSTPEEITLKSAQDTTVTAATKVSVTLPTAFANQKVYITHKNDIYIATADENGKIEFTTNGFSPFTFSLSNSDVVAEVNGNAYKTLQEAADAAKDGKEINIVKNDKLDLNFTDTKSVKVTNKTSGKITVKFNGVNKDVDKDATETFTYTRPSSGGPGSSGGSISAPTTYAVNVNAATNGAVAADKKTASKGTTVTVTASPSKGYVVDAVKVVDKDGKDVAVTEKDGKYVFTMPASAVTVTGSFKAETPAPVALPFTDVKSGNWFYDAVKYAYAQGLMTGTSATTFAPNGTMNRAMIVTVLYRLEKSPAVTGASKFTDVPAGQWYSDAVAWAAANKIVNGYDETTFGPMNAVTREQMAAILFRYEQVKGLENVTLEENLNRFPDQNKISAYAIPALQWAVGQKIINGNADGTLDPTGTATRAQVAQIFTNLLNK